MARAYLHAHRYVDALRHIERAFALEPTPARIITRAKILMAARKFPETIKSLEQDMNRLTDPDEAYLLTGYCHLEMQKWAQADSVLNKIKKDTSQYLQAQKIRQRLMPFLPEK